MIEIKYEVFIGLIVFPFLFMFGTFFFRMKFVLFMVLIKSKYRKFTAEINFYKIA